MINIVADYYKNYTNSKINFDVFHNNVINMPRASFDELSDLIRVLQNVAGYISMIDKDVLNGVFNYKDIYGEMLKNYRNGIFPQKRDVRFELTYFAEKGDINQIYDRLGRRFRHYMEYMLFFGVFKNENNRFKKTIDLDALNELLLSSRDNIFDILRSRLLEININNNDFIKNLEGVDVHKEADYRPARSILVYCKNIGRPATIFELSVLFGRVDDLQNEKSILKRASDIGKSLPSDQLEQIKYFFSNMNWKNSNGSLYEYSASQQPFFKFKSFILFMKAFKLINYDEITNTITLTNYSSALIGNDISFDVLDLNNLLVMIDDDTENSNKLLDVVIRGRSEIINKAIEEDGELIYKFNRRSIRNPIIKNGKRVRNRLIMELAKIKAGYIDEVTKVSSFEGKNGKNYVEAHHIIEFKGENGPDITDNLICLGPQNHSLIHHGSNNAVEDFYKTCQSRGVINLERFKKICEKYRCLTYEHVDTLLSKKLISKYDAIELRELIDKNGIDEDFLNSLSTPSQD